MRPVGPPESRNGQKRGRDLPAGLVGRERLRPAHGPNTLNFLFARCRPTPPLFGDAPAQTGSACNSLIFYPSPETVAIWQHLSPYDRKDTRVRVFDLQHPAGD